MKIDCFGDNTVVLCWRYWEWGGASPPTGGDGDCWDPEDWRQVRRQPLNMYSRSRFHEHPKTKSQRLTKRGPGRGREFRTYPARGFSFLQTKFSSKKLSLVPFEVPMAILNSVFAAIFDFKIDSPVSLSPESRDSLVLWRNSLLSKALEILFQIRITPWKFGQIRNRLKGHLNRDHEKISSEKNPSFLTFHLRWT